MATTPPVPPIENYPDDWNREGQHGTEGSRHSYAQSNSQTDSTPYSMKQASDAILVRGMVIDENSHALGGADVVFMDQWRNKVLYRTRTERSGEWFIKVPPEQYVICFSKDDLYDEVQEIAIIAVIDGVQEYPTVQLGFSPEEFRIGRYEKYYIKCLRSFLRDKNPNELQIDEHKYLYTDDGLVVFTHLALNDVNAYPAKTGYALADVPVQWRTLLVIGASIFSLISRGLLENMNQFQYSDAGLSLTIQRAAHFQSTEQALFTQYVQMKTTIKAQWKVKPALIMRANVPFHIRTYAPRQWRLR